MKSTIARTSFLGRRSTLGRQLRSESGQSLLELALLTPILLILVIGLAEMGRFAYFDILVGNAARAGAAWGAQSLPTSADAADISTAAQTDFKNGAGLAGLTVTSSNVCGCDNGGTFTAAAACSGAGAGTCATGHWVVLVKVTASGTFSPIFTYPAGGLFGFLNIPSLTLSSTATERVAQ
jgi:Flp pilus assembly protein TadG